MRIDKKFYLYDDKEHHKEILDWLEGKDNVSSSVIEGLELLMKRDRGDILVIPANSNLFNAFTELTKNVDKKEVIKKDTPAATFLNNLL